MKKKPNFLSSMYSIAGTVSIVVGLLTRQDSPAIIGALLLIVSQLEEFQCK